MAADIRMRLPGGGVPSICSGMYASAITVNGAPRDMPPGQTVALLLQDVALDHRKVAVEHNEAIVPRSRYGDTELAPGDQIEIVHFIGGG